MKSNKHTFFTYGKLLMFLFTYTSAIALFSSKAIEVFGN